MTRSALPDMESSCGQSRPFTTVTCTPVFRLGQSPAYPCSIYDSHLHTRVLLRPVTYTPMLRLRQSPSRRVVNLVGLGPVASVYDSHVCTRVVTVEGVGRDAKRDVRLSRSPASSCGKFGKGVGMRKSAASRLYSRDRSTCFFNRSNC